MVAPQQVGEPGKETVGSHGIYVVNNRLASFPDLHPAIAVNKTIEKKERSGNYNVNSPRKPW